MKTITEFNIFTIKDALKKRDELTAAGKTAEELPVSMGEALIMEGDKLKFFMHALELVGKKTDYLKRVLVMSPASEGEKAPQGAVAFEDKFFMTEYFPQPEKKGAERGRGGRDERGGGRGDKRGGRDKGGKGGRGGDRGGRDGARAPRDGERSFGAPRGEGGGRGPRGPRPEGDSLVASTGPQGVGIPPEGTAPAESARQPRAPRPPREPRAPRPPRAPIVPPPPGFKIAPKNPGAMKPVGAAEATASEAPSQSETENKPS